VRHEDLREQDASVVTHILPGGLRYLSRSQPAGELHLAHADILVTAPAGAWEVGRRMLRHDDAVRHSTGGCVAVNSRML